MLTSTTSVPTAASSSTLGFGELYVPANTGVASLTGSTSIRTNAVPIPNLTYHFNHCNCLAKIGMNNRTATELNTC